MIDRTSPRPWRIDGATILDAEGRVVAVCRQAKPSNTMIALDNARLIVEAVNRTEREVGGCSCGARFYSHEDLGAHAEHCPDAPAENT
jgi:hypothetical protein